MGATRTVFAQLLEQVPRSHFEHLVDKFAANKGMHSFSAWAHFVALCYAQLSGRRGLRDLVACLNSQHTRLYRLGLRAKLSRSTFADAAMRRDWRLFEALAQRLIAQAVAAHQHDAYPLQLDVPLYAMDI